ncbi:MAG: glycosyltransferase [bacterium]
MTSFLKSSIKSIRYRHKVEKFSRELAIISSSNSAHCQQQPLQHRNPYKIAFVIPGMSRYSGGHTSILRLGTYLCNFGHEVYYLTYSQDSKKSMEMNAEANLPGYRGTFLERRTWPAYRFDIGIATKWISCYHLLAYQDRFARKAYFIQDFEPFFYPVGDYYLMALNTYKMGFRMISLGRWNRKMIERFVPNTRVSCIDFPFEIKQYAIQKRRIEIQRVVRFAVYLKRDPKRAPFLLVEHLSYLSKKLEEAGLIVEINFFGLEKYLKMPIGNNLGKLTADQLKSLYQNVHFGLIASLTNISLVNYEMIASGLPVIDLADGSAADFFSQDELIFIESHPQDLFHKVQYYLMNQEKLNQLIDQAQKKLKNQTWENSAHQFHQLLFEEDN